MSALVLFPAEELLPAAWRDFPNHGPVRVFNPALLPDGAGWLFAYRVVGPDGRRRIALCRLDAALRVIAGSPLALTDLVRFRAGHHYAEPATIWFADPRLYRLGGQIFIYWNSGWHEPRNHQFVQELDPGDFSPIGFPRELVLRGERQKLEKNWTLFGDGPFHAIYSVNPHRVLDFSLAGAGEIECTDAVTRSWDTTAYANSHGGLRGGAPPQLVDGHYWSFCHAVSGSEGDYRYTPVAYQFAASRPFAPTAAPIRPLAFGETGAPRRRSFPKLNPAVGEVIYPCGAAFREGRWFVSHGINDEQCAIAILSHADVVATVRPVATQG